MEIQVIKQNLIYIGIAIIVFILLSLIKPENPFHVTGIILPITKTTLSPSADPVQLFQSMPEMATKLAYINAEAHSLAPSQQQENVMIAYAKSMAQKAGANGLLIKAFGYEGSSQANPAPLAKYVLWAVAIKTK